MIYLDYAAHTPVNQQVFEAFQEATLKYIANPNASHALGKEAKARIDVATKQIALLLGVTQDSILYTSGATEANNLAIKGIAGQYRRNGKHIITSYLEHSSVTSPIAALQKQGYDVDFVDILPNGQVDLTHLKELLRTDTVLISLAAIDSEIGTIQPLDAIATLLEAYPNCFFHVDATQAIGKIALDLERIDLVTFAAHKLYGINGCGVLVKKPAIVLEPLLHGGVSTTPYRSGTPTLGLIIAAEKALEYVVDTQEVAHRHVTQLNKRLREALKLYPDLYINSPEEATPYILNISFKKIASIAMQEALAERDVYVATKSACCTLHTPSRPVYALTKDRKRALATLRISLSHLTTDTEITQFLEAFKACYQQLTT